MPLNTKQYVRDHFWYVPEFVQDEIQEEIERSDTVKWIVFPAESPGHQIEISLLDAPDFPGDN